MDLALWIGMFIISLAVLIKSSDYFTVAAEKIGVCFGIPAFIVGVTIVSIGTSLPELASSIVATIQGSSEIVIGNVAGSNIANILLILGVAAIIGKTLKVSWELVSVDLPLLVGSAILLVAVAMDGEITMLDGILCLLGYLIYLMYTISARHLRREKTNKRKLGWKPPVLLILSAGFIYFSATYTIESIVKLSQLLDIGKDLIAVSAVALGTSLPEMMVSIVAASKGKSEIAIGNVLGSNIFNSFAVIGIPAMIGTLAVPESMIKFTLPVMLVATLMYFFITQDKKVTRWEGSMLVLLYIFFVSKIFNIL
ncbi:MAG: calcium/sodium antiporter [Patescibacteria group bacterium]|nr:calcium/sodium antiporter [Patescibacteria group bacterium]